MAKPITNITIVGGGTAGWIAAAYLNHRLQWGLTARPGVKITVIESPDIPTVGVGEATVPTLKGTLRILEISEAEFVERTNATFKLGIRFDNWGRRVDGTPYGYVHPFTGGAAVRGRNPGYSFSQYGLPGEPGARGNDFIDTVSHTRGAFNGVKGPRAIGAPDFSGPMQYAYHVDAALLAGFFREVCVARGVDHIRDKVNQVKLDERGFIASLSLEERGDWPVELIIDCTGFSGLLINQALGEPFDSLSDYLLNDRAVPIQVMRKDQRKIVPATVARAMPSGWSWRIPLFSGRDGTGNVYSSAFMSDDEAATQLVDLIGDEEMVTDPRVIRMRVGRSRRSWVKNCVAIGASSGFLEPLESTTIMAVELSSRWLLQNFPTLDFEAPLQRQFNRNLERFYDEVRDFLGLHFSLSNPADTPYWNAVRHEAKRSDGLEETLAVWKHVLPSIADARHDTIFSHWSVQCVLFGKGFYEDASLTQVDVVPPDVWRIYWAEQRARRRATLDSLPDHFELVEAIRARAVAGDSAGRSPKGRTLELEDDVVLESTRVMFDTAMARRSRTAESALRDG
ncbi:MAG: tryptophan halogenase family protein [Pseudomonadota bacterium]